ncbi:6,7-dimethyl-8-ribityllumazine synthase [soil metagenome]
MATTDPNLFSIDTGILKKDACVVIFRTEWNDSIVGKMEEGCRNILDQYGVRHKVIMVPGAFELPFGIKSYWENTETKPDAFIALGCVVRGGTPHFEYVSKAVTDGILQLNLLLRVPVIFGVLTVDNDQQAEERTGGIHGHKGEEAALTALKMIGLNSTQQP